MALRHPLSCMDTTRNKELGGLSGLSNDKPVQYCLYARKSSESEEKQALSIDSQIKEMLAIAQRDSLYVADIYRESHSAKDCGQRPVFNKLLTEIKNGNFTGILAWHPDRLSRNARDLGPFFYFLS